MDLQSRELLQSKFGWEEYAVFALTFLLSTGIGLFFWCQGQTSRSELLLGGKQMGVFPTSMSLVASFLSAVSLLAFPAEIYVNGVTLWLVVFPNVLICVITAVVYLPVYKRLKVSTSYEYLEWRFDSTMRAIAAILFSIQTCLYMSIVVYVPALAIEQLTGMNTDVVCALTFTICIFYTTLGGLKAVMWTDTFQVVVILLSLLLLYVKAIGEVGGFDNFWEVNKNNGRLSIESDVNPLVRYSALSVCLGTIFNWLPTFATSQTQVQRYLSVPRTRDAVRALLVNAIATGLLLSLCAFSGLLAFAYYHQAGCDPIASMQVSSQDQILAMHMMHLMGDIPFFPGLFVSGVFSGALSTVSSGLNSLAAVFWQDFVINIFHLRVSETTSTTLTKLIVLCYGTLCYLLVHVIRVIPSSAEATFLIFGVVSSPILGVFTLGMFFPWANSKGSHVGTVAGLAVGAWLSVGQQIAKHNGNYVVPLLNTSTEACPSDWMANVTSEHSAPLFNSSSATFDFGWFPHLQLYEISYMYFGGISLLTTLAVGLLVSLLSEPLNPKRLNPHLITPLVRFYFEDALGMGTHYVPTEKERRLQQEQIGASIRIENCEEKHRDGQNELAGVQ